MCLEFLTNLAGMLSNDGFIKNSPMNIYVCVLTGFFNPKMSTHMSVKSLLKADMSTKVEEQLLGVSLLLLTKPLIANLWIACKQDSLTLKKR